MADVGGEADLGGLAAAAADDELLRSADQQVRAQVEVRPARVAIVPLLSALRPLWVDMDGDARHQTVECTRRTADLIMPAAAAGSCCGRRRRQRLLWWHQLVRGPAEAGVPQHAHCPRAGRKVTGLFAKVQGLASEKLCFRAKTLREREALQDPGCGRAASEAACACREAADRSAPGAARGRPRCMRAWTR